MEEKKKFELSVGSYIVGGVESIPHGLDSRRGFLSRETVRNWSKTSISDHFLTLFLEHFQQIAVSEGLAELFGLENRTQRVNSKRAYLVFARWANFRFRPEKFSPCNPCQFFSSLD